MGCKMTAISTLWQTNEVFRALEPLLFETFEFFLRKSQKTNFGAVNRFLAIFPKSKHFRVYFASLLLYKCSHCRHFEPPGKFLRPSGAENGNSDSLKTHKWAYAWPVFKRSNFEVSLKTLSLLLRITLRPILYKIADGISYNRDEAKIILIEKLSKKGQNRSIFLLHRILHRI
jgi:hypothetical protein